MSRSRVGAGRRQALYGVPCDGYFPCDVHDGLNEEPVNKADKVCEVSCQIRFAEANDNGVADSANMPAVGAAISVDLCSLPTAGMIATCTGNCVINSANVRGITGASRGGRFSRRCANGEE